VKDAAVDAISVQGLAKRFGEVQAVADVSFEVREGELFGFLGPNGAGKTTTIHMLTGLARPDAGKIRIAAIDCAANPKAAQHLIGVVPDESNLYPELTGFDNLCFCAALYGMQKNGREARARELLETFGLAGAAGRKFNGYSRGMKRRLTIAVDVVAYALALAAAALLQCGDHCRLRQTDSRREGTIWVCRVRIAGAWNDGARIAPV
jgi:ABC-2 type transport system ATP-binding protein